VTAWSVIVAIGVVSYVLRAGALLVVAGRTLPERLRLHLGLVGPAAIAALLASFVLTSGATMRVAPVAELLAVVGAMLAVGRTGNLLHAFVVGLPVLWLATLLGA
jgi:branched-subunit amino acid transport protein